MIFSLHKSLSQEKNLRDQFNNTLGDIEEQLKERDGLVDRAQMDNNKLLAQLKAVHDEKQKMAMELEKARQGQREAEDNNTK